MKFFLSQRAAVEVKQLSKKKPTKNVKQDICSFFIALETIENIRNVDETLGPKGKNSTIKKSRVTNSILNEKSGGYRLYFIISERSSEIIISSIYSKKTISNYSKEEIKSVFRSTNEDIISKDLIPFKCKL
jgi:mRNA-degrading endonuclease RelE of RelBE toxin-antitoxin system